MHVVHVQAADSEILELAENWRADRYKSNLKLLWSFPASSVSHVGLEEQR